LARVRAGLAIIACLTLLTAGVFFLDAAVRAKTEGEQIVVVTPSAPGLRPGSPVWVAGRPAGRVLSVELLGPGPGVDHVLIRAALDRGAEPILRADAHAEVGASDLMAPVFVLIDPGTSHDPWNYADTLRSAGHLLDQERVRALADTLLQATVRLQEGVEAARSTLAAGSGSLHRFADNPALLQNLRADLALLERMWVEDVPGSTLGRLATDTLLGPAASRIRERFAALAEDPGREGAIRSIEEVTEAFDALSERIEGLVQGLQAGRGTAGRALVDGELVRQLEALRNRLAKLTDELSRRPERWLRIRIF